MNYKLFSYLLAQTSSGGFLEWVLLLQQKENLHHGFGGFWGVLGVFCSIVYD